MKRILIDTNFYSAFKRNHHAAVETLRAADVIAINPIVLAELFSGFMLGSKNDINNRELKEFMESPRVSVLTITEETAAFYMMVFVTLKKNGTPLPTNDLWIAASAMQHGLQLVSFDAHFDKVAGLLFRRFTAETG